MSPVISPAGAVVIDANIPLAIVASEPGEPKASAAITRYAGLNYEFYAPGAILAETLYVLCGKLQDGNLTPMEHTQAIADLDAFMQMVNSPPNPESVLLLRAEAIRGTYSCRRSADGIYIALAEVLRTTQPAVLLTFDEDMAQQATKFAPTVRVDLLTI